MKKFFIIFFIIIALILTAGIVYYKSGHNIAFIDDYMKNFSDNILNLKIKYEQKKSEIEEKNNSEAKDTNIPLEDEPTSSPTPTASHASKKESDKPVFSDTELPKELKLTCNPIAITGASTAKYATHLNNVLCVTESSIDSYTSKGEKIWSIPIQISNPILKVNGTYILLMEQKGKKLSVYNGKRELYHAETSDSILTGNISASGDCVIVTDKKYYKGAVTVYNKSGQEVFSRSFGSENVISAAISDSRRLAVSLMSVENHAMSKIVFLDINKTVEDVSIKYDNSIIYDIDFSDNTLIAYADDKLIALDSNGKESWVHNFDTKTLNHYQKDSQNIRLLMFDNKNNAELSIINSSGKEKEKIETDIIPDFCDICNGYIIYNNGRNLFLTRINGNPLAKYTSSRDIYKAYFIDSDNILIVYNQSIEFLHTEKGV